MSEGQGGNMYKNGYVVAVLANGNVVEENGQRIQLPFGTEYKVRLINKNTKRCASDLIINGEKIARFILDTGETSDIERYLDGNLSNGKRFKFTHLNDTAVKDKQDIDNGMIEVHFFAEKIKPSSTIIREEHHHHHWDQLPYTPPPTYPDPFSPKPWTNPSGPYYGDHTICYNSVDMQSQTLSFGGMTTDALTLNCSAGLPGATVRGAESKQEFQLVSGYDFESVATIMKVMIINGEATVATRYCGGCGRKRRDGDKHCGNCGNKY